MARLGTMITDRHLVLQTLNEIRQELGVLLGDANKFLQSALAWAQNPISQLGSLPGFGQGRDATRLLEAQLEQLQTRLKKISRRIALWIETSFDAATQKDLKNRFFPHIPIFFVGGGIESAADDLRRDVRQLADEAEDVETRIGHFSDPHARAPSSSDPQEVAAGTRDIIFVAYSRENDEWLERLKTHMRPLERNKKVELWADTSLKPGQKWRQEIEDVLKRATVAALLVSADFLASEFVANVELPAILRAEAERGLLVVPIFVAPCNVPQDLAQFQGLNSPNKTLEESRRPEADRVLVNLVKLMQQRLAS